MTLLWSELDDLADSLAVAGQVDIKSLKTIRAAAIQMENWFTAAQELREEKDAAMSRIQQQDTALHALADVFFHAAKFARAEITLDEYATGITDKAPFQNIMAAYGLNSIGGHLPAKRTRKPKAVAL